MKQISLTKINELLKSLKGQRADLLEDKTHMLDHYDLDNEQDEFDYNCVCDEIADIDSAIDNIYNVLYHPQTIIEDGVVYYVEED